ncbi:MAG TPA: hypothetical protein VM934_15450 [Pyrinomonadaceae bacterium]|jgi:hypothetical protein|nr:hypothetical protein [Pyrinomonadaceae bacterium]
MFGNSEQEATTKGGGEDSREWAPSACPACGAAAQRAGARYCGTCGRSLDAEDYFPTDAVRASYHQQRPQASPFVFNAPRTASRDDRQTTLRKRRAKPPAPSTPNSNGASTTAMAFVTYSLVPYLGIIFCPGALLMGGIGLVRAYRAPHAGGGRTSVLSITMGVVIFGAQMLLWWILYKVPQWGQQPPGF